MAKFIAVWGSPNSGKTTFATKLALSIYEEYQSTIIVIYTDMETPTLPIIFPNEKKENLFSIGVPLSGTDITQEDVAKQIVTVKRKSNLGFMGFKDGENKYTYPRFDEGKVSALFSVLGILANYVIIDCTSSLSNPLSSVAVKTADEVIRLASPDLKSISYFSSQLPLYVDPVFKMDRQVCGLNIPNEDLYMPIEDARAHIADVRFTIPYCRSVKQQLFDGKLYQPINDKKFNNKFRAIVEKVV